MKGPMKQHIRQSLKSLFV